MSNGYSGVPVTMEAEHQRYMTALHFLKILHKIKLRISNQGVLHIIHAGPFLGPTDYILEAYRKSYNGNHSAKSLVPVMRKPVELEEDRNAALPLLISALLYRSHDHCQSVRDISMMLQAANSRLET